MSINSKLLAIQSELKAPKGQFNAFGKYKYRSCEDIFEAVKPLLKKHEVTLVMSDSIQFVGERVYVHTQATLSDGQHSITVSGWAREEEEKKGMDGSQITGASSSYARKYALNGLFLIDDTKDSDGTNTHGQTEEKPKAKPAKAAPQPEQTEQAQPSTGASIMDKAVNYMKSQTNRQKAYDNVMTHYGEQLTEAQKTALKKFIR